MHDSIQQLLLAEWLGQEVDRFRFHSMDRCGNVALASKKNDRNLDLGFIQLALEIKLLVPDVPIVLLSGYAVLPPTELAFVDAHFGHGTHLDDLVDTMRRLTNSKPQISRMSATSWSDST